MKVDPHQTIAGQPIRKIRDFLRVVGSFEFTREKVIERIGADVTGWLLAEGFIEPTLRGQNESEQFFRRTQLGSRLALAHLNRRIGRTKAAEIVAGFLERVEAVNADPELLMSVTEVYAFGSYTTDAPDLGDIDLAVGLEYRLLPGQDWIELNIRRAQTSRRRLRMLEQLVYGEIEVVARLRNRNPYLALHCLKSFRGQGGVGQRIFPSPSPDPLAAVPTVNSPKGAGGRSQTKSRKTRKSGSKIIP